MYFIDNKKHKCKKCKKAVSDYYFYPNNKQAKRVYYICKECLKKQLMLKPYHDIKKVINKQWEI